MALTADQVVVKRDDGTVVSVCWQLSPAAIFVTQTGDEDFEEVVRHLGLPAVSVKEVSP